MWLLNMLLRSQGYINASIESITLEVIVSLYLKLVKTLLKYYFTLVDTTEENGGVLL